MLQSQAREKLCESLSAAVDGEAAELELRRVLNALDADAELRAEWARSHLISALLRGGDRAATFAERPWLRAASVPAETESRVAVAKPARRRELPWERWAWPATGAAAAVVTAVAVVLAFWPSDAVQAPAAQVASADVGFIGGANTSHATGGAVRGLTRNPSDADLRRVNTYMLRHAHQSAMSRTGVAHLPVGTAPFAKVLAARDGISADPPTAIPAMHRAGREGRR